MWTNFTEKDLRCQETGEWNNHPAFIPFMNAVQALRTEMGFPFYVTSGYRSPQHSIEAAKAKPGAHTRAAIDFRVTTEQSWKVVQRAMQMGFYGIGIKKSNVAGCCIIHLDADPERPMQRLWGY
jgi:uncharacterized protein YcbK (DUF882 family)